MRRTIWDFPDQPDVQMVEDLSEELSISPIIAGILLNRDFKSPESVRGFFACDLEDLHDPFRIKGMEKAVQRIIQAVEVGEKIIIYGDYDVDGVTSTSVLLIVLRNIGANVDYFIPNRFDDGYGLSVSGIDKTILKGAKLIITVDNGISANKEIDYVNQQGADLIVVDHHVPDDILPKAYSIINPKQEDCPYPEKNLAAVGLSFKLSQALYQIKNYHMDDLYEIMDIVAIGTVADIVPMIGENRIITRHGISQLGNTTNFGIQALLENTNLTDTKMAAGNILFSIGPRLNAGGRLGNAGLGVELLTAKNIIDARKFADALETENKKRREIDSETLESALSLIENTNYLENKKSIVLYSDTWHLGVIGIVASRLVEKYYLPTVLISFNEGIGRGSARSIHGFNIHSAFKKCADLLENYGGHKYAAGLSIQKSNVDKFVKMMESIAQEELTQENMTPRITVDKEVKLQEIDNNLLNSINSFAPFGPQNSKPLFATRDIQLVGTPRIVGKNHLKFKIIQEGTIFDTIGFGLGEYLNIIESKRNGFDVAYQIEGNEWQGRYSIQLRIKDIK